MTWFPCLEEKEGGPGRSRWGERSGRVIAVREREKDHRGRSKLRPPHSKANRTIQPPQTLKGEEGGHGREGVPGTDGKRRIPLWQGDQQTTGKEVHALHGGVRRPDLKTNYK